MKQSGIENEIRGEVFGGWGGESLADVIVSPSFLLADGFAIGPRYWFNLLIRYRLTRRAATASIKAARPRETEGKEGENREIMKDGGGDAGK